MTDHRLIVLGAAAAWGALLGLFYFGGLWWTLKYLPGRSCPKTLLALSFVIRTALVLLGFWIVLRKEILPFLFTIVAFFLVRFLLVKRLGVSK